MSTLLKKLSIKGICGAIASPKIGETVELAVIMGFAREMVDKVTTFGDSTGFIGDFKGINIDTGEEFRAGTCYLPDVATDLLKNAMKNTEGIVEFGFKISVMGVKAREGDDHSKYEYRCSPLTESAENDPMALLENRIKQKTHAGPKVKELQPAKKEPQPAKKEPQPAKKGGK